jgi:hypothetical protein
MIAVVALRAFCVIGIFQNSEFWCGIMVLRACSGVEVADGSLSYGHDNLWRRVHLEKLIPAKLSRNFSPVFTTDL